ncbi:hypothetical protein RRG08_031323 [Elysia crispata]|uniref:Uncharacterized protein n=1 Tax=Elysia crispata TaxID=231223 RepID=A0AAE0YIF6_9GAST|nr:hypothetical protein RRG08_031323 [Elysia crispata]
MTFSVSKMANGGGQAVPSLSLLTTQDDDRDVARSRMGESRKPRVGEEPVECFHEWCSPPPGKPAHYSLLVLTAKFPRCSGL